MEYGLNNKEIGKVMGVSEKRVRNLIYEATRRLREYAATVFPIEVTMN